MLDKAKIIDAIREINVSAARDWLDRFEAPALHHYLDHLQRTLEPRGGVSPEICQRAVNIALIPVTPRRIQRPSAAAASRARRHSHHWPRNASELV